MIENSMLKAEKTGLSHGFWAEFGVVIGLPIAVVITLASVFATRATNVQEKNSQDYQSLLTKVNEDPVSFTSPAQCIATGRSVEVCLASLNNALALADLSGHFPAQALLAGYPELQQRWTADDDASPLFKAGKPVVGWRINGHKPQLAVPLYSVG